MEATRQAVTHIRESRRFESMYNLQGKPDIHDMYASRASPRMSPVRFLWAVPIHGNLLCSRQQHWAELLLPRKMDSRLYPQHSRWLFPHSHWSSRDRVKHLLSTGYIGLLGPHLQHVISTFNTCSCITTPRSLSYPVPRKRERSLHTCAQDVQITCMATIW
jgi:hypothetical protein